jgi:hypothetical protein
MKVQSEAPAAPMPLPAGLTDVALIDARTCAQVGGMSLSWWHEAVRAGLAPAPAFRRPRCTRWHLGGVREFWQRFAEQGACSASEARTHTLAKKASAAATARRQSAKTQAAAVVA